MRILDPGTEKIIWVGSIVVLLLLTLFPFTSPPEGMVVALREGNRSYSFWTLRQGLPVLNGFVIVLALNIVLGLLGIGRWFRTRAQLILNLLGVGLFVMQFVFL